MKSVILLFVVSVTNNFIVAIYPQYSGSEAQPLYSSWSTNPNYPPSPPSSSGPSFPLPNQSQSQYASPKLISNYAQNQKTTPKSSYVQPATNVQNQPESTFVPPQLISDYGVNQPELNYAQINRGISAQQEQGIIFAQRRQEVDPEQEVLFTKSLPVQKIWPQASDHTYGGDSYTPQPKHWTLNSYIPNASNLQKQYPPSAVAYPWHSNGNQNVPTPLQNTNYYGSSSDKTEVSATTEFQNHAENKASNKDVKNHNMVTQKTRFQLMYPNGKIEQIDVLDDTLLGKAKLITSGDIYTEKDIKEKFWTNNSDQTLYQSNKSENKNIYDNFNQNRPHNEHPQNEKAFVSASKRNVHIVTVKPGISATVNRGSINKIYRPRYTYHNPKNIINHGSYSHTPAANNTGYNNKNQKPVSKPPVPTKNRNHEINKNKRLPQFTTMWHPNYRKPNDSQKPINNIILTGSQHDKNVSYVHMQENNTQNYKPNYTSSIKPKLENFRNSPTFHTTGPDTSYNHNPNSDTQSTYEQNNPSKNKFSFKTAHTQTPWIQNINHVNNKIISNPYTTTHFNNNEPKNAESLFLPYLETSTKQTSKMTYNDETTLKPLGKTDYDDLSYDDSNKSNVQESNFQTSSNVTSLNPGDKNSTTEAYNKEITNGSPAWISQNYFENEDSFDNYEISDIKANESNSQETNFNDKSANYNDYKTTTVENEYNSDSYFSSTTESDDIITLSPVEKISTNIVDYTTDDSTASTPTTTTITDAVDVIETSDITAKHSESGDDGSENVKDNESEKVKAMDNLKNIDKLPFWFGTEEQLWDKALAEEYNALYVFDVTINPTVEKHTKAYVFENGTTVEEISETIWENKDDPLPKEIKITTIIRNPTAERPDKPQCDKTGDEIPKMCT